jgi:SAM-dependent methyltransferase
MGRREELLDRIRPKLVCPSCRIALDDHIDGSQMRLLRCASCGVTVRRDHAFRFQGLSDETQKQDWLNTVKAKAKHRLGRFYPLAIDALGPVYGEPGAEPFVATFGADEIVCDFGSGTCSYGDRVVSIDGYAYDNVHVVCDLAALPFADGTIDGIISQAVLEHVPDPAAHVAEMFRVLRPGGRVHCFFPFMQGFHASPHDYSRMTINGLKHLFGKFTDCSVRVAGGPTSGLLWTLQEWIAIAGSFGSERLYRAIVPLTWVLSPLKYIDSILMKHPSAHVISSGFVIEATKPAAPHRRLDDRLTKSAPR